MLSCVDLTNSNCEGISPERNAGPGNALQRDDRTYGRHLRFGPFELKLDSRELSKFGARIRLQAKPAQILEVLATRPGELVRREELCARLWPTGTFVDFESGLNTAVNRLRAVLADTAESSRYIETIPRLGYRFIGPVEDVKKGPADDDAEEDGGKLGGPIPVDLGTTPAAFGKRMFFRLALATMLAFIIQGLLIYASGASTGSRPCPVRLTPSGSSIASTRTGFDYFL